MSSGSEPTMNWDLLIHMIKCLQLKASIIITKVTISFFCYYSYVSRIIGSNRFFYPVL